ncbi:MAG: hypothetical protein VKP62_03915 [Candidatus Sericytochromatia bacterium]|nr:hypothetical protein [Candidatus Sericytochromatia bacterium]
MSTCWRWLGVIWFGLGLFTGAALAAPAEQSGSNDDASLRFVHALIAGHRRLHEQLADASERGGRTGQAALELRAILEPHFLEEERLTWLPLLHLQAVVLGRPLPQGRRALALAEELKGAWPRLRREHNGLTDAVSNLREAAIAEGHADVVRFAEGLSEHALWEEFVTYPAILLMGEKLRRMGVTP